LAICVKFALFFYLMNFFFVSTGDTVKIGEISYRLKTPRNPELVPVNHSMC